MSKQVPKPDSRLVLTLSVEEDDEHVGAVYDVPVARLEVSVDGIDALMRSFVGKLPEGARLVAETVAASYRSMLESRDPVGQALRDDVAARRAPMPAGASPVCVACLNGQHARCTGCHCPHMPPSTKGTAG